MSEFVFKNHIVGEAKFVENSDRIKRKSIEIAIGGGILIPKDEKGKAVVKLNIQMGKEDERLFFTLKTISVFEYNGESVATEEEVREKCLPIAFAKLRTTVNKVLDAYGRPGIELPPFEEEDLI